MKTEPVKVLYFVDRMLRGGIQSLVIDWVSRFDKQKIHVDFLLLDDGKEYELEQTLKELGCTVYKLKGIWVKTPIDFIKYKCAVKSFFKEHHDYKVVHMHSSSKNYMILKYAKKYGIQIRIAHSHNIDFQTKNPLKKLIGNLFKKPLIKYATDYFACSKIAGEWLFGKDIVESDKFRVIHNAIDYDKFKYNSNIRKKMREEFNFKDSDIVIGHVGRFVEQKNHCFLIDIFAELCRKNSNYKLLLVGKGKLENNIREKIKKDNIEDKVIFAGFRNDANKLFNAMDIFVFPSLFEGLGLVLIEAQANGVPCLATGITIPDEVHINSNFKFLPLDKKKWVEEIKKTNITRYVDCKKKLIENDYLIDNVVNELEQLYIKNN